MSTKLQTTKNIDRTIMLKQRNVLPGKWCTCGDGNVEIRAANYPDDTVIEFKPSQKCYSFLPVENTHGIGYTYVVEAEKSAFVAACF